MTIPRQRDSAKTRQMLLEAARRRFALQGYAATTVRDVADDAGVNVALIARYFGSKEGLFDACLERAVEELRQSTADVHGIPAVVEAISRHVVGASRQDWTGEVLLLLVRSSGDPGVEEKRLDMLRAFSMGIASAAGWQPDRAGADELLLGAEMVLSLAIGAVILRTSSAGLEPLGSAAEAQIASQLRTLISAGLRRGHEPAAK